MARRGDLTIRRLRPGDGDQLTDLLRLSFAEEFAGAATDPAAIQRQVRAAGWSQRPGLRHTLSLLGARFAYFVAVYRGRIIGSTAVSGSRLSVVSSVAVLPEFRRAGVARALVERAQRFTLEHGRDRVSLDVLAHNTPALTLYGSMGYREYHRYRAYEIPEMLASGRSATPPDVWLEPPTPRRATAFSAVERAAMPPRYFEVAPTLRDRYLRSRTVQALDRLAGGVRSHRRVALRGGRTVGFVVASTMPGHGEGRIEYPLIVPDADDALIAALTDAIQFIEESGPRSVRLDLSEDRPDQHAVAESLGFRHRWTFVQMVNLLSAPVRIPVRIGSGPRPLAGEE